MLREISYEELIEWYEYFKLEPFGQVRADMNFAHIVQTLINLNRDPKKTKAVTLEDCMLKSRENAKKQTWQEQKMIAQMYAAMFAEAK